MSNHQGYTDLNIRCKFDEFIKLEELKPNPKNRNEHPEKQIERYKEIVEYQGLRSPIRVSKRSGVMTKGHGLLMVLKSRGDEFAPIEYQDYDSEEMEYADLIADNELQKWSLTNLGQVNQDIIDLGPELNLEMLGMKDFKVEPMERIEINGQNYGDKNKEIDVDSFGSDLSKECPRCGFEYND